LSSKKIVSVPQKFSITHKCFTYLDPEVNIGQSSQAAPSDGAPGRSVILAIEVAAKFGDDEQVVSYVPRRWPICFI